MAGEDRVFASWTSDQVKKSIIENLNKREESNLLGDMTLSNDKPKRKSLSYYAALDNLLLPSNRGQKQLLANGSSISAYANLIDGLVFKGLRGIIPVIFWRTLPDPTSELLHAYYEKKWSEIPSGIVTMLVNTPLLVMHIGGLGAEMALRVLASPTILTNLALTRATNARSPTWQRVGYYILTGLTGILTLPFQIANVAANTIQYGRHVVDSAVTFAKAAVNLGLDTLFKLPTAIINRDPKGLTESFKKYSGMMGYAAKDFLKNAWNLVPVAVVAVAAVYSGGLSIIASNLATVTGAGNVALALASKVLPQVLVEMTAFATAVQLAGTARSRINEIGASVYNNLFPQKPVGKVGVNPVAPVSASVSNSTKQIVSGLGKVPSKPIPIQKSKNRVEMPKETPSSYDSFVETIKTNEPVSDDNDNRPGSELGNSPHF